MKAVVLFIVQFLYLDKVQQASETPGNRIEPFGARIGPLGVNQHSKITV